MAQVLVEDQHRAGYYAPVERLEDVPRAPVQVAIDVGVRQRTSLVDRRQEFRYRVPEQPLVKHDVVPLLHLRHGPPGAVAAGRLVPPRHRKAGEGVEAVYGHV